MIAGSRSPCSAFGGSPDDGQSHFARPSANSTNSSGAFSKADARILRETRIALDGVPGKDITYSIRGEAGTGDVLRRARFYVKDRYQYELVVTSPPGQPVTPLAARFLASLTFDSLVRAQHESKGSKRLASLAASPTPATAKAKSKARQAASPADPGIQLSDATPEAALKTFLLALAAQDAAKLRAVTLPDRDFDWLLKGRPASPELLAEMRKQLENAPMRRLVSGDRVTMPGNRSGTIQPSDVRSGRCVLLPSGARSPTRLQQEDGHWKVFAGPYITARKLAKSERGKR
jgi:hypothetical protein